jgi:hypothetical protein
MPGQRVEEAARGCPESSPPEPRDAVPPFLDPPFSHKHIDRKHA